MAVATNYRNIERRASETAENSFSPERILELADILQDKMEQAIWEISEINDRTNLLALNARIESHRAGGESGAAFGVVASAIKDLSDRSSTVAIKMARETKDAIAELERISKQLATTVRGSRLADIAQAAMEKMDRSLYERGRDIKCWAGDSCCVEALTSRSPEALRIAGQRLSTLLDHSPAYFDLILCDMDGRVVASGRPQTYRYEGLNCAGMNWFRAATNDQRENGFAVTGVHASPLVGNTSALVYACPVCTDGNANGQPLGILATVFNWDAFVRPIFSAAPLTSEERSRTRLCLVDPEGDLLADSRLDMKSEMFRLPETIVQSRQKKGYANTVFTGKNCCLGWSVSNSNETTGKGWCFVLIQEV